MTDAQASAFAGLICGIVLGLTLASVKGCIDKQNSKVAMAAQDNSKDYFVVGGGEKPVLVDGVRVGQRWDFHSSDPYAKTHAIVLTGVNGNYVQYQYESSDSFYSMSVDMLRTCYKLSRDSE